MGQRRYRHAYQQHSTLRARGPGSTELVVKAKTLQNNTYGQIQCGVGSGQSGPIVIEFAPTVKPFPFFGALSSASNCWTGSPLGKKRKILEVLNENVIGVLVNTTSDDRRTRRAECALRMTAFNNLRK